MNTQVFSKCASDAVEMIPIILKPKKSNAEEYSMIYRTTHQFSIVWCAWVSSQGCWVTIGIFGFRTYLSTCILDITYCVYYIDLWLLISLSIHYYLVLINTYCCMASDRLKLSDIIHIWSFRFLSLMLGNHCIAFKLIQ